MARLRIDELIPAVVREPRRRDVIVDQAIELGIGQHPDAIGKSFVENRMVARRQRRRLVPHVRPRESARVGDLQPEIQIAVGVRPEALAMRARSARRATRRSTPESPGVSINWFGFARPS